MSYLVLARKYRPRRFADLVGQEHVAKTLSNAIALNRVHHAFLFTGARGVGKTSSARILAMALSCEKGPTPDPCGVCGLCREIASGQSVDVLEIDGASNTGVDDVRTLREGVKYAPARARKKVYIIDEVHMLSTSAFNALLKTLEEPPAHVVFILATTEVHKIPATIMSRVQRYDFKLVPTARLVEHLGTVLAAEGIKFDADGLRVVAKQAGGSVRDALSLLDQVIAFVGDEAITAERAASVLGLADNRLLFSLGTAVLAKDVALAVRTLAHALDRGVDLVSLSRNFLTFLHDLEMVALLSHPEDVVDLTGEEIVEAKALAKQLTPGLIQTLFERWARAVEEGGKSPSARLVYEMALVDLCLAEPLLPLGDLLGRLEGLETRLAGGAPPPAGGPPAPGRRPTAPAEPAPPVAPPASRGMSGGGPQALALVTPIAAHAWAPPQNDVPAPPSPARVAEPRPAPGMGDLVRFWRDVKDLLQQRSPMLAAALEHAGVSSANEGLLAVVLPEKFQCEQVEKNRAKVEAAMQEVAGMPIRLDVKQGESRAAVMPSTVRSEADAADADRRRREEEARKHPMIQKAQDVFGAKVTGIKT
ncbi:MAG: DNA polymerase III subunit gamma/tau [Deltaproteobacteria bacterium]|nr:DNA polymerase III subunit gamma/tau [Deltaproteobacteria bacterium]